MDLHGHLRSLGPLALAFSGGADSSFLLKAAVDAGVDVRPYFVHTMFCRSGDLDHAVTMCQHIGVGLDVIELDMCSVPGVISNPPDRCYACKSMIFRSVIDALGDEERIIVDGTNASDDESDRPGMRALRELGVRSPLRECGFTKDMVRECSKGLGLPTWDLPSDSCLATRVPTSTPISKELLDRIEQAEDRIRDMGFPGCRVRSDGTSCRIQVMSRDLDRAHGIRSDLEDSVSDLFSYACLTEEGR